MWIQKIKKVTKNKMWKQKYNTGNFSQLLGPCDPAYIDIDGDLLTMFLFLTQNWNSIIIEIREASKLISLYYLGVIPNGGRRVNQKFLNFAKEWTKMVEINPKTNQNQEPWNHSQIIPADKFWRLPFDRLVNRWEDLVINK